MKILHLRFSEIWPGKGKRYGRTDGHTRNQDLYMSPAGGDI